MPKSSAYLVFEDRPLRLVVTTETAEHSSTVTEFNVEEGAKVSDHVRSEPDRVTLQAIISNTPVKDLNDWYGMQVAGLELQVPKREKPILPTPGSLMTAGIDAIAAALNPPEPWKAIVLQAPAAFNAVKEEIGMLLDWKERGVLGKVITEWRDYNNMVITRVAPGRSEPIDGVEVSIELRSIRLVEVGAATLPIPEEVRGNVQVNKGRQPTTELPEGPKKSVAKAFAEKFFGR